MRPVRWARRSAHAALELAKGIVDGLERERRLERHLAAGIALALLCAGAHCWRPRVPTRRRRRRPSSRATRRTRRDSTATRSAPTSRCATPGWRAARWISTSATPCSRTGRSPRAIASYERARRLLPRDPDVQANLAYALELAQVPAEAAPLWKRLAFPFAARATGSELAVLASLCWWAFWLLLAARVC